jgi:hypothetical protein
VVVVLISARLEVSVLAPASCCQCVENVKPDSRRVFVYCKCICTTKDNAFRICTPSFVHLWQLLNAADCALSLNNFVDMGWETRNNFVVVTDLIYSVRVFFSPEKRGSIFHDSGKFAQHVLPVDVCRCNNTGDRRRSGWTRRQERRRRA